MTAPSAASPARKTRWAWAAATFFGVGNIKPGPGTWGSIAALALWYGGAHLPHLGPGLLPWLTAAATLVALAVGVPAGTVVARESGTEDPQHVVIDEVAGQWIALITCPVDWKHPLVALALFRLFDIFKPPPARQLEDLPGGWGIMLDDVAAGLYALLVLQILRHWF